VAMVEVEVAVAADEMCLNQSKTRERSVSDADTAIPDIWDRLSSSVSDVSDEESTPEGPKATSTLRDELLMVVLLAVPLLFAILLSRLFLPGFVAAVVWSFGLFSAAACGLLPGRSAN
ncbi:unnamed protein product, partial [Polarella glacialis]